MSNCNCCGCIVVDVLHRYVYSDSRYTLEAVQELLESGGNVLDCSAAAYPTTVTTAEAWAVSAWALANIVNGTASGGESSLNLGASAVQVSGGSWLPLAGRTHAYIYAEGSPPTEDEQTAAVSVSLLGEVDAALTAQLVARNLPEEFASQWQIYFDPDDPPSYGAVVNPSGLLPIQRQPYSPALTSGVYIRSPYMIQVQASVVDCLQSPYTGSFAPFLVQAIYDLPEPEITVNTTNGPRVIPAHPGTPLEDFIGRSMDGLESTIVYAENVKLQSLGNFNDQAWSVHEPRKEVGPPNTEGFQAKLHMTCGGESRLLVGAPVYSHISAPTPLSLAICCLSLGDPIELPANGLCTAYVDRGAAGPYWPGYYDNRLTQKTRHTYLCDGVEVFTSVDPTPEQIANATKAVGSYLAVYESATADAWSGDGPDTRKWTPGLHKTYGSFIRDTTPPVVGFTAPNDVFWSGALPRPLGRVVATEPLVGVWLGGKVYVCAPDERAGSFYARPALSAEFLNNTNGTAIEDAGDYVLRPVAAEALVGGWNPASLTDEAGNPPAFIPTVRWKAHATPPDNKLGATATLTDVGLQTCEYYRARSQQEKVASVTLSFDRKIDPASVDIEQFTLTRWDDDGASSVVSGVEIEPVDDGSFKWVATIPTEGQAERTFWILEYDPAGEVFTDDVATVVLTSIDNRPREGQTKTIYVYPDPGNPERQARSYWSCQGERENPNLTPYVWGYDGTTAGSGAVLSATMTSNGDDPETWGVAAINVIDGGSGYQVGEYFWYSEFGLGFDNVPPYYIARIDAWLITSVDENGAITGVGFEFFGGDGQGAFYKAGPGRYVDLAEGELPLDCSGVPYTPEPCVLAARTSWLMADESGWPRPINTGHTTGQHAIGRVASLSHQVTLGKDAVDEPAKRITTISADDNITLPVTLGTYSPRPIRDGYVPSVPTVSTPTLRHSYFGLATTIDPCTPDSVSACSAPSVAQKHASAIRCDEDITGFEIELVAYSGINAFAVEGLADMSKVDAGNTGDFSVLSPLNDQSNQSNQSPGSGLAIVLLAKDGGPITFGTTLADETLPQNVWMAVEESRDTEIPINTAVSRPPDATCTTGDHQGQWYHLRYRFDNTEHTDEEVLGWPAIKVRWPAIRREDGTVVNGLNGGVFGNDEIELLPGDTYHGSFYPPSQAGQPVPWWQYRRPPEVWPTDWTLTHGQDSGIVRQLSGGAVTQSGLQACLSAWREHRTYPALKTTTLGDLQLFISIRMTLKADVDYTDWQLEPVLFTRAMDASPCNGLVRYDDDSLIFANGTSIEDGGVPNSNWPPSAPSARGYTSVVDGTIVRLMRTEPSVLYLNAWQKLTDATEADSRTVTHQFAADIEDLLVLTKEQEELLADGEDVMVLSRYAFGGRVYFWRIRKA